MSPKPRARSLGILLHTMGTWRLSKSFSAGCRPTGPKRTRIENGDEHALLPMSSNVLLAKGARVPTIDSGNDRCHLNHLP